MCCSICLGENPGRPPTRWSYFLVWIVIRCLLLARREVLVLQSACERSGDSGTWRRTRPRAGGIPGPQEGISERGEGQPRGARDPGRSLLGGADVARDRELPD